MFQCNKESFTKYMCNALQYVHVLTFWTGLYKRQLNLSLD
jgi:hypothetical protein